MSRSQAKLRSVPTAAEPVTEPAPDTSYEAEQRRRIMSRDWPTVHIEADRRLPFASVFRWFR
jgi:hypothetical protein